jgi:hypothetical protein
MKELPGGNETKAKRQWNNHHEETKNSIEINACRNKISYEKAAGCEWDKNDEFPVWDEGASAETWNETDALNERKSISFHSQ